MEIEDGPKINNSKTHESQTKTRRTTTPGFPQRQREGPKTKSVGEGKFDRKHPSSDSSEMARRPPTIEDSPTNPSWFTPKSMDSEVGDLKSDLEQKMLQSFKNLMTRVASFEESVAVGNKLLVGFQQGLELLRRPPVNVNSELVEKTLKANESRRVLTYIEAGCINIHDSVQSMSNLRSCLLGLQEHIDRAKTMLDESKCLLADATVVMQDANESLLTNQDIDSYDMLPNLAIINNEGEAAFPWNQNPELTDYATMMTIIYNMMKQDFLMQERIVSALDLKLPSGELESYCLMWSLRPFIDDDIMGEAWKLVH